MLFFLEDNFWPLEYLSLTKNENLEASWPQDFFLKVEPCHGVLPRIALRCKLVQSTGGIDCVRVAIQF